MDSPVIVDTASKFGRGIDLDSSFPGFPFDDDGFGRRGDIRAHLDDLAARHPEFADHLLGPPWGDIPFHGTLRNRRRGSGSGGSYQGHPDEDARSQASGSSAASAASGASAVSSHGEPDSNFKQTQERRHNYNQEPRRNQIPQYGLRNTVDIGQHHHNMENLDKGNRGQRSMSAPPENRQTDQLPQQQEQQGQQPQGQRFVSRVDITPQHNQSQQQQPQQKPQQQQHQKPQQQGNVRHIPIFVEGRDEPVIPRNVEDAPFRREPSPPQFHSQPHFQRTSPFGQHFTGRPQWSPHFEDPFYQTPSSYEQPTSRRPQSRQYYHQPKQQYAERERPESQQQQQRPHPQAHAYPQTQQPPQSTQQQQQPQQPQPQQQPEPPKPKQTLPKDPLERVALVQKEVDSLAEQVKKFTGNSRKDKEYMYLDEMLTRELIKLDDIETEGRDNVRQTRKNAIKCIQETISLLESKAPLPGQEQPREEQEVQDKEGSTMVEAAQTEEMEIEQKQREQSKEPNSEPSGIDTATKETMETSDAKVQGEESKDHSVGSTASQNDQIQQQQEPAASPASTEPMDASPAEQTEVSTTMEVQQVTENLSNEQASNASEEQKEAEGKKSENVSDGKNPENVPEKKQAVEMEQQKPAEVQEKMDVDDQAKQSPKMLKRGKKAKKQTPVSEEAIPLPPPQSVESIAE